MSVQITAMSDQLKKVRIERKDSEQVLECQFNPSQYTLDKQGKWESTPARAAASAPKQEFVGTLPHSLGMELFFESWESGRDIAADIAMLFEWTRPTKESIQKGQPHPPILTFYWGRPLGFDVYLTSVSVTYEMFNKDGTPLRAKAVVKLMEIPGEEAGTNPTSGGVGAYRTHVLAAGETLHSVAFREYGQARYWRGLAVVNGIDDPLDVRSGTRLRVPPLAEAAAAS
jgi:nucleoid-associated protein YgaU